MSGFRYINLSKDSVEIYFIYDDKTNLSHILEKNSNGLITKNVGNPVIGYMQIGGFTSGPFIQRTLSKEFEQIVEHVGKD